MMQHSPQDSISTTELARNLAITLDRVRMTGCHLDITKGKQTIAELRPARKTGFPIARLADLLRAAVTLHDNDRTFANDVRMAKQQAQLPGNPWD